MKKLLLAALLLFVPAVAHAQTPSNVGTLAQRPSICVVSGNVGPNNQFIPSGAELYYATDNSTVYVCITTNTWQAFGGGGGGISGGCNTTNQIVKSTGATSIGCSSGLDVPPNPTQWPNGISIMAKPLTELFTNSSGGTTQFLVAAQANGTITTATTAEADSGELVGVVVQGAGTSGNAQVAVLGQTSVVCDNQTVVGDWVQLSTTAAGQCHDGGVAPIPGELNFGTVYSPNVGASTQSVILINFPGAVGAASNPPLIVPGYVAGVTQHAASYTVQPSDNNHVVALVGTTAAQTLTLPQPGTNGTTTYTGQFGQNLICSSASTCDSTTFNVTVGQAIIAWSIIAGGTSTAVTVTDSVGDTFVQVGATLNPQTGYYTQFFWTSNSVGGTGLTVTSTTTSGTGNLQIMAGAFANIIGPDQTAGQSGGNGAAIQSPLVTTTSAVELLVGGVEQACGAPSTPVSGYSNITAGQFMWNLVGVAGSYVAGLASTCNVSARWAAQIATFTVNGSAPQYANGYGFWAPNYSNQTWTIATTSSTLTDCGGTAAASTSYAAAQGWFIESDGANYFAQCGQGGGGGGGSGTVTTFSAGDLSPLFTSSVANATTTPALTFALSNAAAHTFLGNNTGSTTAPAYEAIGVADLPITPNGNTTVYATVSGAVVNGNCAAWDASGNLVDNGSPCGSGGGGGTVTSVGLALPGIFIVSGSPVTTTGSLAAALATETANRVWAGPVSGGAATPTFRALVSADIPNNAANTSGSAATAAALSGTPTQCTGGQVATGIAASGNANCTSVGTGNVSGTGSAGQLAVFTAAAAIGSSSFADNGTAASTSEPFTSPSVTTNSSGAGVISFTTLSTVSGLPSAASNGGAMIAVSDSTTISAEGQTCVGSGSQVALAFSNGVNWKCF